MYATKNKITTLKILLPNNFATDLGSFGAANPAYNTKNKPRSALAILLLYTVSNTPLTLRLISSTVFMNI